MRIGPEVVALDLGVDVRRREEARDAASRCRSAARSVAARIDGRHERDREERRERTERRDRAVDELGDLAGQVVEAGRRRCPRNCSARTMYQKPSQVSGRPYTSGARNGPGPQRQLEEDEHDRHRQGSRHTRRSGAAGAGCRGSTARTYSRDRRRQQQGQRVVADGQPEHDGRGDQRSVTRPRRRRRPRASSHATSRRSRIATSARWSAWASAWVPIAQTIVGQGQAEPGQHPERRRAGQGPGQVDRDGRRDRRR